MNAVAKHVLLNLDSIVLATPSVLCTATGAGFRWMEESKNPVLSGIGYLGSRTCVVLGAVAALPLLVWNCAKSIFAKMLNWATLGRVQILKDYANYTDITMKVTMAAIPAVGITALTYPTMIKTAISVKDFVTDLVNKGSEIFKEIKKAIDNFQQQGGLQGITDAIKKYNKEQDEKKAKAESTEAKPTQVCTFPLEKPIESKTSTSSESVKPLLAKAKKQKIEKEKASEPLKNNDATSQPVFSGKDPSDIEFDLTVAQIDANVAAKAKEEAIAKQTKSDKIIPLTQTTEEVLPLAVGDTVVAAAVAPKSDETVVISINDNLDPKPILDVLVTGAAPALTEVPPQVIVMNVQV